MRPTTYKYKADNSPSIGFIAQDMEAISPEVVRSENGEKGIGFGLLTSVLVMAIQEQQAIIEEWKANNMSIKKELKEIRTSLGIN